jgi:hypothetical protein
MTFDLESAHRLLPKVQAITAEAVRHAEGIVAEVQRLPDSEPRRADLEQDLRRVIEQWAQAVAALGGEAKGLWLVDFDNGQGYWCWKHPEPSIEYYHSYDEGFAGRKLIAPSTVH